MALIIPDGTTSGDILDPSVYMIPGWCSTVDCVQDSWLSGLTTKEVFDAELATGNYCFIGAHRNTLRAYSSSPSPYGNDPNVPPTCEQLYAYYQTLLENNTPVGGSEYFVNTNNYMIKVTNIRHASCWGTIVGNGQYANSPCGAYLPITSWELLYDTWGSPYWRIYGHIIADLYMYDYLPFTCPENSHKEDGICVPDDGYVYDPITHEFVTTCDTRVPKHCITMPDTPLEPIVSGDYSGDILIDSLPVECDQDIDVTLYFEYREIYTDSAEGLKENKFIYDAPRSINIKNTDNVTLNINNINANGKSGYIEVSVTATEARFYQCNQLRIPISYTNEYGTRDFNLCSSSLFDDKFKIWKDCGGFAEPQYVGNVLKDGTILED